MEAGTIVAVEYLPDFIKVLVRYHRMTTETVIRIRPTNCRFGVEDWVQWDRNRLVWKGVTLFRAEYDTKKWWKFWEK